MQNRKAASFIQQLRTRLRMLTVCPVAEADMVTPPVMQGIAISGPDPSQNHRITDAPESWATDYTALRIKP